MELSNLEGIITRTSVMGPFIISEIGDGEKYFTRQLYPTKIIGFGGKSLITSKMRFTSKELEEFHDFSSDHLRRKFIRGAFGDKNDN